VPGIEGDHRALVVAEVAQEPPQPLGATHVPVRHDKDVIADTCSRRRARELFGIR
jgi:hypothetical protein